jgi:dihydrofolate reductase
VTTGSECFRTVEFAVEFPIRGGATITSFLNLKLIDEMTITRIPILLGEGIPLFGKLNNCIKLENSEATASSNDFIQIKYSVNYT